MASLRGDLSPHIAVHALIVEQKKAADRLSSTAFVLYRGFLGFNYPSGIDDFARSFFLLRPYSS